MCKERHTASDGERQNSYCYLVTGYEGRLVCRSAEEIFWEEDVEKLSLEVDRKIIAKLTKLRF